MSAVTTFTVSASLGSQAVTAGQSVQYNVTVGPENYANPVLFSLACPDATCSLSCMSVTPINGGCGTSSEPAVLTVLTTASSVRPALRRAPIMTLMMFACLIGTLVIPRNRSARNGRVLWLLLTCSLFLSSVTMVACVGGLSGNSIATIGDPGNNSPQTFQVTINGSSGNVSESAQVTLTVQ